MKNEKLKSKHLVTVRLNDAEFINLNSLSKKYHMSYSKLLRILLNSYYFYSSNLPSYENR